MNTLALYIHDLDPYAIGPIRWYGLSYIAGFFVAWLWVRRVLRVGVTTLKPEHAGDMVVTLALGLVIGGRLGYVLFYEPKLLITITDSLPYWGLLAINQGGMASHGGMIGGAVAAYLFSRKHQQPILFIWDLFAFAAPLGLFFGRIANFVNGELYGRECSENFFLAVIFPTDPQQLPRHPSQLYQAALEGFVLFLILLWFYRKPRRPGTVGAVFLFAYATLRIIGEQFREPDEHLGLQWLDLTRGQWLSIAMFVAGLAVLVYVKARNESPMGGWLKQST